MLTTGEVNFIDFEYCNKLDALYDITNFFAEWMYRYENKEWYKPDENLFPTKNQIKFFCEEYFSSDDVNIDSYINQIIETFPKTHHFWSKWASTMEGNEYKLFKSHRDILMDKDHNTFLNLKQVKQYNII